MKTLITLTIVLTLTSTLTAREDDFSYTFNTEWLSKYIPPDGFNVHDKDVIQSSLTIAHKSGTYLNIWHSGAAGSHLLDNENAWASEIDWTLGWAGPIGELEVDLGTSYWDLNELFDNSGDMIFSYITLGKTLNIKENQSIFPYINFVNYTLTSGSAYNGNEIAVGIRHRIKINNSLDINSDLGALRNWRVFGATNSTIARLSSRLSWKLDDNTTINAPIIAFYLPLEKGGQETELVFGSGVKFEF